MITTEGLGYGFVLGDLLSPNNGFCDFPL